MSRRASCNWAAAVLALLLAACSQPDTARTSAGTARPKTDSTTPTSLARDASTLGTPGTASGTTADPSASPQANTSAAGNTPPTPPPLPASEGQSAGYPTLPTEPITPTTTTPQLVGGEADRIWADLRANHSDARWLPRVLRITVLTDWATVDTDLVADGRGRVTAQQICIAVLNNGVVQLSGVTVRSEDGTVAGSC